MTSPVDTSVKFFRSNFPGAPTLNGAIGGGLAVLDDCLVNGFGLRTAASLVVSGGVATVALASDAKNANLLYSVIAVAGVTGSLTGLNGEQRVTAASSTTLSFATTEADGTATGTITIKTAPAGWSKPYSGTNKGVFKSADVMANGMYLRVDDSATTSMRVRGYEAMTDVDTGTGLFPTTAQIAGAGGYWAKSTAATSATNEWDLFADSRGFYFAPLAASGSTAGTIGQASYWFGDINAFKVADVFATMLTCTNSAPGNGANLGSAFYVNSDPTFTNARVLPRSHNGLGSAISVQFLPETGANNAYSGADTTLGPFPTATDGGVRLARIMTNEGAQSGASAVPRGLLPGLYHVPQTGVSTYFQRGDYLVAANAPLAGRRLASVYVGSSFADSGTAGGRGFFDVTGPWR